MMIRNPAIVAPLRWIGVLAAALILFSPRPAAAQDMAGTLGQPCFADGTCAVGNACNTDNLCERCGGSGELACRSGTPCQEAYRGFGVVSAGLGALYCVYLPQDAAFRQNCGSAGFLMCPGTDSCWGASVALGGLCVACGLLGQYCCDEGDCREPDIGCVDRRCVPVAQAPPPGPGSPPTDLIDPETGSRRTLRDCTCWSTDGRHNDCRAGGCAQPANFSGTCYWVCDDTDGNTWDIRARDREILAVTRP